MANSSIYAVFERMWQHALAKFNNCVQVDVFDNHTNDYENPHNVTKEQIGLDQVDNTSDLEKPISDATQAALDAHTFDTDNPHEVTKEQIGLANVDDTADLDKPISDATQAALDEKADLGHVHDLDEIISDVLDVEHGGTGYNSIIDTTYSAARYRASALVRTETYPYDNGVINWVYE